MNTAAPVAPALGADSIDDCELLRAGRIGRLLGGWMAAPAVAHFPPGQFNAKAWTVFADERRYLASAIEIRRPL